MIIRKARREDALAIARIHVHAWRVAYEGIVPDTLLDGVDVLERARKWEESFEHSDGASLYVAEDALGEMGGWILLGPRRDAAATAGDAEIWALYADPKHFGSGIGQLLWSYAHAWSVLHGYRRIVAWMIAQNERGRKFYRRAGFTEIAGSLADFTWLGHTLEEVCFMRDIDPTSEGIGEPPWLVRAFSQRGVAPAGVGEINPAIVQYHALTNIRGYDDKVAWCSSFVNWCLSEVGIAGTNSALARSWLQWGEPLSVPRRGCIVVLSRDAPDGWQGHVGFFLEAGEDDVTLWGGNQLDCVCANRYPMATVLGYRWPTPGHEQSTQSQIVLNPA